MERVIHVVDKFDPKLHHSEIGLMHDESMLGCTNRFLGIDVRQHGNHKMD